MASTYPGAVDVLALPAAGSLVEDLPAELAGGAHAAIIAVESTLGVNPQGAEATVDARLTATEGVANAALPNTTPLLQLGPGSTQAMPGDTVIPTPTPAETKATILSKLGATVVTGSNTGDQDLSAYAKTADTATSAQGALADTAVQPAGLPDLSGYALITSLGTAAALDTGDTSGKVPVLGASGTYAPARLGTGTASSTTYLDGTGAFSTPAGGGGVGSVGAAQFQIGVMAAGNDNLTTFPMSTFSTVPFAGVTPTVNVGGGTWDATAYTYKIPVAGTYLVRGTFRMQDNQTAANGFLNIGTSNVDDPTGVWGPATGPSPSKRTVQQVVKFVSYAVNDLVRLYAYVDGLSAPYKGASMSLLLLAAS